MQRFTLAAQQHVGRGGRWALLGKKGREEGGGVDIVDNGHWKDMFRSGNL